MQGTSAIQLAAITFFFIQLGKVRHREDKRLSFLASGSAMSLWGKILPPIPYWCDFISGSKSRHMTQAWQIGKGKPSQE